MKKIIIVFLTVFIINYIFAGISKTPEYILKINQPFAFFAQSVSIAGDVNDDGYVDIIIGAPNYKYNGEDRGAVFVYYGNKNGLDTNYSWISICDQKDIGYGNSVSYAGDINGDGYDDIIVGAPVYKYNGKKSGAVFVYYGSKNGLSKKYDWIGIGEKEYSFYGKKVCTAGDINGDGYDDIIVGAKYYKGQKYHEGAVYVYYGNRKGLSKNYDWKIVGNEKGINLGASISTAGDVNGDNYDDIIVGAPVYKYNGKKSGAVFVYYGSKNGLSKKYDWKIIGDEKCKELGMSVSTAGDVNGDGYDDIIIGTSEYYKNGQKTGVVYAYYGSKKGLSKNYNWKMCGNRHNSGFGMTLSEARDINKDGYNDIIIGSPHYSFNSAEQGAVFIYYGSKEGLSKKYDIIDLKNKSVYNFGISISSIEYINDDEYSDILIGAQKYINAENGGAAFIFLGSD